MRTFEVEIQGIRPLLMHRFAQETADEKVKKTTGAHDASKEAEQALYRHPDGTLYQPAEHIEGALRQAAKDFRITGKRSRSYSSLVEAEVEVTPRAIPHKIQKWVTDARPVVVKATKGRIIRYRPRFDNWGLNFQLIVHDDQIPTEVIKEILDHAGKREGLGDYRPKYGRFMVVKFQEIKT